MGVNMKTINHISKAVASLFMAIITVFVYMPLTSLAINENFDNPDSSFDISMHISNLSYCNKMVNYTCFNISMQI